MKVSTWMRRYYKPERFRNEPGFNADREQRLIADRENDMKTQGFAVISFHDSTTGNLEVLGNRPDWLHSLENSHITAWR